MAIEDKWMDDVEKYVLEEDKIVSYKWLSKKLHVHVNVSKQLLYTFASQHESENLGICYLVGGMMPDGSFRIVVSKKKEVPKIKNDFKLITSEHVYSIQKNKTEADLNAVLPSINDKDEETEDIVKCSSIECSDSVKRNNTAFQELKLKALLANKSSNGSGIKSSAPEMKKQLKSEKENLPKNELTDSVKKENGVEVETTKNKKTSGIAAMFAAQKEIKKPESKNKPQPTQKKSPKNCLSAFLNSGKTSSVNVNKNDKKGSGISSVENIKQNEVQVKPDSDKDVSPKSEEDDLPKTSKEIEKPKEKQKTKSKAKGKRKRKESVEDKTDKKKRKRIVMLSDTESSEDEEDEPMDVSPSREPTPPPPLVSEDEDEIPATPQVGKKVKKRKLTEKTFMDKDGYLVTTKEYVMVSASEDEDDNKEDSVVNGNTGVSQKPIIKTSPKTTPISPSKNKKSPSKGKKSPAQSKKEQSPQKVKQASIKSFFTKK